MILISAGHLRKYKEREQNMARYVRNLSWYW